jgi:hypothetical protein
VNLLRYEKVLEEKHLCFFPPTKRTRQRKQGKAKQKKGNGTTLMRAAQESIF